MPVWVDVHCVVVQTVDEQVAMKARTSNHLELELEAVVGARNWTLGFLQQEQEVLLTAEPSL